MVFSHVVFCFVRCLVRCLLLSVAFCWRCWFSSGFGAGGCAGRWVSVAVVGCVGLLLVSWAFGAGLVGWCVVVSVGSVAAVGGFGLVGLVCWVFGGFGSLFFMVPD